MGRETAITLAVSKDKSISKDCCFLDCDALHSCYCENFKSHKSTSMWFHTQTSVSITNGRYPTACNTWKKLIRHNNAYNINPFTVLLLNHEHDTELLLKNDREQHSCEIFMLMTMKNTVFWNVMSCGLLVSEVFTDISEEHPPFFHKISFMGLIPLPCSPCSYACTEGSDPRYPFPCIHITFSSLH